MTLRVCSGCARHVRHTERACPFCATLLKPAPERVPLVLPRAGRAAIVAFGAVVSTAPGCGGPVYGGPPVDAAIDARRPPEIDAPLAAAEDAPSGSDAREVPTDVGTDAMAESDAASIEDAGQMMEDDVGGAVLLYGGPGT